MAQILTQIAPNTKQSKHKLVLRNIGNDGWEDEGSAHCKHVIEPSKGTRVLVFTKYSRNTEGIKE